MKSYIVILIFKITNKKPMIDASKIGFCNMFKKSLKISTIKDFFLSNSIKKLVRLKSAIVSINNIRLIGMDTFPQKPVCIKGCPYSHNLDKKH